MERTNEMCTPRPLNHRRCQNKCPRTPPHSPPALRHTYRWTPAHVRHMKICPPADTNELSVHPRLCGQGGGLRRTSDWPTAGRARRSRSTSCSHRVSAARAAAMDVSVRQGAPGQLASYVPSDGFPGLFPTFWTLEAAAGGGERVFRRCGTRERRGRMGGWKGGSWQRRWRLRERLWARGYPAE